MRPSSSFRGMHERQFFSFDPAVGRLVIDLNIEGPNGANNFIPSGVGAQGVVTDSPQQVAQCFGCGKKRRTPESEDIDLNELPPTDVDDDEEEYCTCENPPVIMQEAGGMNNLHAGSSRHGVNGNQQGQSSAAAGGGQGTEIRVVASPEAVENNSNNGGGRSRRARMRGTPRRVVTSTVEAGSSSEIPTYEETPITIVPNVDPTFVSVAPPGTTVNGATPFRIRDIVSRQDNNVLRTFGSRVEVHRSHPSSARGDYPLTIGQTSHGQNPPTSQPHLQISNLQPSIMNSQSGSSLTNNVAQNLIVNPTQLVEQHPQTAASTFGDGLDQRQFVGPMQLMSSGTNSGETRVPNFQTTNGNMQPRATRVDFDGRILHRHLLLQQSLHLQLMQMSGGEIGGVLAGVEEMTYEQLSALGERIGIVNTGLTEEVIQQCLRHRYYRAPQNRAPPEEAESCCICLVDFVNRDVLGRINCLHKFHFDCIKKWLLEKNFCPLCKQTALVPPN